MGIRRAEAVWQKGLKDGTGRIKFANGQFDQPYSFASRFEQGEGTNPEELMGAAHAGCFSMALANELEKTGHAPSQVSTKAEVNLGEESGAPSITEIHLTTDVHVSGIDDAAFQKIATGAKENCPVSKALAGTNITLTARLV